MPTLRNAEQRAEIIARLKRLTPASTARWGTLTSATVLPHMSDQFRVALGAIVCVRRDTLFTRTFMKWLVVNTPMQAPRGKVRTSPEMLTTRPGGWEEDLAECVRLCERVGTGEPRGIHPAFGPFTPEEWGRMGWKHTDHHLVQFGV